MVISVWLVILFDWGVTVEQKYKDKGRNRNRKKVGMSWGRAIKIFLTIFNLVWPNGNLCPFPPSTFLFQMPRATIMLGS